MTPDDARRLAREIVEALLAACDEHGPIAPNYADTIVAPLIVAALASSRSVWVVEEGVEGEGTYTLAICASREVADAITTRLNRAGVGVEEVAPETDADAWFRETQI